MKRRHSGGLGPFSSSTTEVVVQDQDSHVHPILKLREPKQSRHSLVLQLTTELSPFHPVCEKLRSIARISRNPFGSVEDIEQAVKYLKDVVKRENDISVRVACFRLLKNLIQHPGLNKLMVAEEMVDVLQREKNDVIVTHLLRMLTIAADGLPPKTDVKSKIMKLTFKALENGNHHVRGAALALISQLCEREVIKVGGGRSVVNVVELFGDFCCDQDPRVRTASLCAVLTIHERGISIDKTCYEKASAALTDDHEDVRRAAMKVIWVICQLQPQASLDGSESDSCRLIDDTFIKLCTLVNDGSMRVRAQAMQLLGSLHNVGFELLQQTLDKKLMSNLKKKKSVHDRERERFHAEPSGDDSWSTGKVWEDRTPAAETRTETQDDSLMRSGACGAFVRGLEDEFMEVREASVNSLCELSRQNGTFASLASDFLVDMFNDEIELIRLISVSSLIKISDHVNLREDQLDTVLNILSDSSWEIRDLVRSLLAHCTLTTKPCLHATILGLMSNLQKYPDDCRSIWKCMKELALRHHSLAVSLIPDVLNLHPFLAMPDASLDDNAYMGIAIFLFNAAVKAPVILSLLPEYTKRHYDYLRDSLPELVPELRSEADQMTTQTNNGDTILHTFIESALQRLSDFYSNEDNTIEDQINVVRTTIKDIKQIATASQSLQACIRFYALYLEAIALVLEAKLSPIWKSFSVDQSEQILLLRRKIKKLLLIGYRLEHGFSSYSSSLSDGIKQIRCTAFVMDLIANSRLSRDKNSPEQYLHSTKRLLKQMNKYRPVESVASYITLLEGNLTDEVIDNLCNLFTTQKICIPSYVDTINEGVASVSEPSIHRETSQKFVAGLTVAVHFDCVFSNVKYPENLFIKIVYPDLKVELFKPNFSEIKKIDESTYRLVTDVICNHRAWSTACKIHLSAVYKYDTEDPDHIPLPSDDTTVQDRCIDDAMFNDDLQRCLLALSSPVPVNLLPK